MSIYSGHRFLNTNLVTSTMLTASSQAAGIVESYVKTYSIDGSALLYAAGNFSGLVDLTILVQIDSVSSGDDIGNATFRYRYDTTESGSWEASGQATATTGTSVGNGVSVYFESIGDTDFTVGDSWEIQCKAIFTLANLLDLSRDSTWRSTDFDDEELLTNNDFESGFTTGLADGWSKWESTQTFTEETTTVHTAGGSAQKITCADDSDDIGIYQATANIAGEYYYISAWVYQNSERQVILQDADLEGTSSITLVPATTWTQLTWTAKATATASTAFYIYQTAANCTIADYLIIDDVEYRPLPYIKVDLGSAQQATAAILADTNFSDSATIYREANASDAWTSPSIDTTMTLQDPVIEYFDNTYRYHRFIIDDMENSDGYISVTNLYLGTYFQPAHPTSFGSTYGRGLVLQSTDLPNGGISQYVKSQQKRFQLSWGMGNLISTTEIENFLTLRDTLIDLTTGAVSPVFFHYAYEEDDTLFLMRWVNIETFDQVLTQYLLNEFTMVLVEVPKRGV